MDKKRMASLTALTVMLILILGNVAMAHAQSSQDSTGTINVTAECSLSTPQLLSEAEADVNGTALTVNTKYHANVTVGDIDGMDDIVNGTVRAWLTTATGENDSDTENNHYTFFYNATSGQVSSSPAGFLTSGDCVVSNSSSVTQFEFKFKWDYSKVANYSNVANNGWQISFLFYDSEGNSAHLSLTSSLQHGIAEYTECASLSTTHSWSGLSAGSNDNPLSSPGTSLSFTAIANRMWNATAKSNVTAALEHTYSYTLGIGNVTQNSVNNATSSTALTTSEVIIGKDGASPLDAKEIPSSESGTACNCFLWVDIPAGQQPGAYVYKLTITVQKD